MVVRSGTRGTLVGPMVVEERHAKTAWGEIQRRAGWGAGERDKVRGGGEKSPPLPPEELA